MCLSHHYVAPWRVERASNTWDGGRNAAVSYRGAKGAGSVEQPSTQSARPLSKRSGAIREEGLRSKEDQIGE